ncbi:MAG: hypothetical protein PHU75_10305 [Candidatus Nanopelagicales bacterium]|nr:hypothetical protein [Candidatus Nanopelagicales bacterium]
MATQTTTITDATTGHALAHGARALVLLVAAGGLTAITLTTIAALVDGLGS